MDARIPRPERGYLVLADISGFTAYLAGTELEHAHEIIRELLEFIVTRLQPLLTLAQIEGDAVLAYAPEARVPRGETLLELLEATYAAFKDRLTSISRRVTCTCTACRNVTTLDLKFLVHHGEYLTHHIHDYPELLGLAPLFVREREWKEPVAQAVGWRSYALFTTDSLAHLGLPPEGLPVLEFSNGQVKTYGLNLGAWYQAMLEARRVMISPDEADAIFTHDLAAPPPVAWEWLNDPQKRNRWYLSLLHWTARARPGGRTGPGAINHCDHGAGAALETVLDWRPFDYFTVEMRITPGGLILLVTTQLEPLPADRTRLRFCLRLQNPSARWLARPLCGLMVQVLRYGMNQLDRLLAQEK